ncbi:uncharacterized protein LOC143434038 [Arvicanthis niloticus]|uniref:uncharacterized protein LOC143308432 n=1 Tax=Arvicanthis niloticus TaxID=61156 RepID=UPI00402B953F
MKRKQPTVDSTGKELWVLMEQVCTQHRKNKGSYKGLLGRIVSDISSVPLSLKYQTSCSACPPTLSTSPQCNRECVDYMTLNTTLENSLILKREDTHEAGNAPQ